MSFAVPRNVPHFDNSQRAHEDDSWARAGNGNGIGNVFGGHGEKKQLPLYKDKPYYAQARRRPLWRKKRSVIGLCVGIFLLWLLLIRPWSSAKSEDRHRPSGWLSWLSGEAKNVALWEQRRDSVRNAFEKSWASYREHAWGADEYFPIARNGGILATKPLGWMIIDSLDSLMIMNLTTQLSQAREWISKELNFTQNAEVNAFEATTRLMGGLLSAHFISTELPEVVSAPAGDDLYIEAATDLIDKIYGAFDTKSGIPYSFVNLESRRGALSRVNEGATRTSEAAGMQLELTYQTKLIGETLFLDAANKAAGKVYGMKMEDGLPPALVHPETGRFVGEQIGVGENAYAYYVHLIKRYLQTYEQEPRYRELWRQSWRGISKHLLARTKQAGLFTLVQRPSGLGGEALAMMDHSACILPGAIALSVTGGRTISQARKARQWTSKDAQDMSLARELLRTCVAMHRRAASGIAASATHFEIGKAPPLDVASELQAPRPSTKGSNYLPTGYRADLDIRSQEGRGSLQSSLAESLFCMWRITREPEYREMGWELFNSYLQHTTVDDGRAFAEIVNVDVLPTTHHDLMNPAWLSRTLKFFYLLFSPADLLPLDHVVFSAGGHPFPRIKPRKES